MAYLDHAATTPMLPEALEAMTAQLRSPGNASSLHAAGRRARRTVEESREQIARLVNARPSEVVFTGGGTEADNLAVKGLFWSRRRTDRRRNLILVSAVEHHAILDSADWLAATEEAEVRRLPVDELGRVRPQTLLEILEAEGDRVALVSVMWANNEVGTVQPVAELAALAHTFDVPLHTDAVQALGALPVDFAAAGADAMTITGHKIGGPVGVAALVVDAKLSLTPLLHGGGQERDIRSGTLDVAGIAGFAAAAGRAVGEQPRRAAAFAALRDDLVERVLAEVPDAVLNGPPVPEMATDPVPGGRPDRSPEDQRARGQARLPGNAHLSFPGCEGDSLLMLLDARGVECSTGSACSAGVPRPSHVLLAMGIPEERARGSLRFTFGATSTSADVDEVVAAIGPAVERARRAGLSAVPGARSR